MCQYFLIAEDQGSQATKQAAKEAFENNMHYNDSMKRTAKAYLSNGESSIQKAACHILPELKLRIIFPAVDFVNTNTPEERVQLLLSCKEFNEVPDDSLSVLIFNVDRYMERPSATFCNRKSNILQDFCYAKFVAYNTFEKTIK